MKCTGTTAFVTLAGLFGLVRADWQYRSRPDLSPPRLNITIPANPAKVAPGYLFVAPYAGVVDTPTETLGPLQPAPYILRDNGDLVWSGFGYFGGWQGNFQASRWRGQDVLFTFEGDQEANRGRGHGHITFLDQRYETVRELRAGNHKLADLHEFRIIDEETGLLQTYQPIPRDLSSWGGSPDQQWIINPILQELDIATGAVLFEWSSLDHIQPDEAVIPLSAGIAGSGYNASNAWDYLHTNSIDKDAQNNYLVSARHSGTIYKINGTDGRIIWRLNGKYSNFTVPDGVEFHFQHHARWLTQPGDDGIELISLFDNNHPDGSHGTSSGKIVRLDTNAWTAELVAVYRPPKGHALLAKSQGSAQVLPGGNVLVNWGSEGALTEYAADGTPLFHAYVDSGDFGFGAQNYRAFRYNWTGRPSETPAVVALRGVQGATIYVSWNGDTETTAWRFYAVTDRYGSRTYLSEVHRTGFETSLFVPGASDVQQVIAEAIDAGGRVLKTSAAVYIEAEITPGGTPASKIDKPSDGLVDVSEL